jgi:hypothetical protein
MNRFSGTLRLIGDRCVDFTLDVYTQAITPSKQAAQAAVTSHVLSAIGNATSPTNETGTAFRQLRILCGN